MFIIHFKHTISQNTNTNTHTVYLRIYTSARAHTLEEVKLTVIIRRAIDEQDEQNELIVKLLERESKRRKKRKFLESGLGKRRWRDESYVNVLLTEYICIYVQQHTADLSESVTNKMKK